MKTYGIEGQEQEQEQEESIQTQQEEQESDPREYDDIRPVKK